MRAVSDSPWVKSQQVGIKAGERLAVKDGQHRTKGAKGKPFRTSDRPKGPQSVTRAEVEFLGARMNSAQRRAARHRAKLAAEAKNGVRSVPTPALKTEPVFARGTTLQVDYARIRHEGMGPSENLAHHLRTATPMRKGCE